MVAFREGLIVVDQGIQLSEQSPCLLGGGYEVLFELVQYNGRIDLGAVDEEVPGGKVFPEKVDVCVLQAGIGGLPDVFDLGFYGVMPVRP